VFAPREIVFGDGALLLFLRQNGGAAMQARQVASLAFIIGRAGGAARRLDVDERQRRRLVNPAIVSPDGRRACLGGRRDDLLVAGETKARWARWCAPAWRTKPHALVVLT